ncbi:MAG: cytochrome c maturation protein CcmE [Nitrospinota bacterium]
MKKRKFKVKFLVGGMLIVASLGYLVYAGLQGNMAYFLTVEEMLQNKEEFYGQGVRLGGKVVGGTIEWNARTMDLKFLVRGNEVSVPVEYRGPVPDAFKEDADVVLEGKFFPEGVFRAKTLLAKCPSKYETAEAQGEDSEK